VSSDPNVTVPATSHTISNPALLATVSDSFFVQLGPSIVNGSNFSFNVVVSNGTYTYQDTITKIFIGGDTLFYNNCNSIIAFSPTSTWDVTNATYTSATGSITDSPNGNYQDSEDDMVVLNNRIDLTHTLYATLLFQAKWQLEKGYDYTLLEISDDNGSTWNAQCGLYTNIGTNQNDGTDNLYDGYQLNWVQEAVDLTPYLGKRINLRFHLKSDQFLNYDGFYFDDLTVLGRRDSTATSIEALDGQSDWQLFPNPANNIVSIHPTQLNGEEVTIYNALGAKVETQKVMDGNLNLANLEPGIYFIGLHKEAYTQSLKKLVVVK
ncbi:MAG: zinc carboxypeptidase, partial [Bacteroidota bacterium]|nr:zinc carboxypeptidase [Bacteroidota bacterium]